MDGFHDETQRIQCVRALPSWLSHSHFDRGHAVLQTKSFASFDAYFIRQAEWYVCVCVFPNSSKHSDPKSCKCSQERREKTGKSSNVRGSKVRLLQLPCNHAIPIPRQMKPNGGDRTCRDAFVARGGRGKSKMICRLFVPLALMS